ncbi:MAG: hypothetical protein Q4G36_09320 [Paracoccus sp. (in: a-proteobacteria)]|nr:hypothetical protein [Paracoccus sp. (in: a-proteobacteria)]
MTHPIEYQRLLVDQLYQAVIASAPEGFTSAACRFEYDHGYDDGSSRVGSQLTFFVGAERRYALLGDDQAFDVVCQLHAAMKAHTGGDWDAFTLLINDDGSVTTKFEYPDQKPLA